MKKASQAHRRAHRGRPDGLLARDRLMDVAESLMAERGFTAVSIREITIAANANIASIGYHFGSKENLLLALFERRASAMNSEYAAMLDDCEPEALKRPPSIQQLLQAYCKPIFALAKTSGGMRFLRVRNHISVEDSELSRRIKTKYYDPNSRRFLRLFHAACPDLPDETVYWRFNFMVGTVYATVRDKTRIGVLSHGSISIDYDQAMRETIAFLLAGWLAPPPELSEISQRMKRAMETPAS